VLVRASLLSLLISAAVAAPLSAQSAPARPAAQAPAAQPIPRATFLANMDADFARMDANHDGKLVKAEIENSLRASEAQAIMQRNRALFAELDRDHNGQLSPVEFAQFHAVPAPPNATPMLQHFDTSKDGAITQVEFRAGTLANFDRLDTDKNGVVSAAEMRAGGIIKK
jgi:Ca2+-binding EF-hand superfamily protein